MDDEERITLEMEVGAVYDLDDEEDRLELLAELAPVVGEA